jgi:hypothetical protein
MLIVRIPKYRCFQRCCRKFGRTTFWALQLVAIVFDVRRAHTHNNNSNQPCTLVEKRGLSEIGGKRVSCSPPRNKKNNIVNCCLIDSVSFQWLPFLG